MGIIQAKKRILLNEPHIATATGGVASFSTDMRSPLKSCKVEFAPVQEGTGDPSPTNIRPITGWTGVDVVRAGKSIVPFLADSKTNTGSSFINGNAGWCNTWKVPGNRTIKYCYSIYIDNTNATQTSKAKVWFRNKDNTAYVDGTAQDGTAITAGSAGWSTVVVNIAVRTNTYYIAPGYLLQPGATASNPMVEIGDTRTTYEEYKTPTTYPISWTSQGTVYGGLVDPVSGELWKTHEILNLQAANLSSGTDYNFWYTSSIQSLDSVNDGVFCNRCKPVVNTSGKENYNCISWYANSIIRWTEIGTYSMTRQEYNAYLAENPITVTYKLATPVLVATITPQQIKSLIGNNAVWSDANGNVTVEYWKH